MKENHKEVSNSLLIFFCLQFKEFISLVVIRQSVDKQMLSFSHILFKKKETVFDLYLPMSTKKKRKLFFFFHFLSQVCLLPKYIGANYQCMSIFIYALITYTY
jgi:hypothetical protein